MHKAIQKKCKRLLSFVLAVLIVITMIPTVTAEAAAATSMTAEQVVKDMTVGFNIGNTMDAKEDSHTSSSRETAWGNPKITKEFVEAIGAAGFNTVRIPVSWGQYTTGSDYQIPDWWMSRVHEVVDYAIDNNMYVILNTHHDLFYYAPTTGRKAESEKYFKSVWTQIAKEFKNYDSHLVFETMNEPRLEGHSEEWWFNRNSPSSDVQTAIQCINDYNQVALDAIRATGGNNATRCVMVPGYDASTEGCMTAGFKMPKDSATDRLILSVHAYTPYDFTLNSYGTDKFTDTSAIDSVFNDVNSKFLSKGIPVIIGEMGASNKNNTAERVKWADYYWGKAANYPTVAMCLWDNNILTDQSNPGECHRYFDRNSYQITFPEIFDTIMKHVDGTPAKSASGQGNHDGNNDGNDYQSQGNQGQQAEPVTPVNSDTGRAGEIVRDMTSGWNLGNSLDVVGEASGYPFSTSVETYWGNPQTTKEMVDAVAKAGFNTIRIPVTWGQYTTGDDYKIPEWWMSHVKEVVDYAYNNDMYVIINSHHDIGDRCTFYYPDNAHRAQSEKYLTCIWTQIADEFKDYSDKLIFETMNEPRLAGTDDEWWFPRENPNAAIEEAVECLNDYNQVIVDTIRKSGGKNATRCIMVSGYDSSIDGAMVAGFKLPKDTAEKRIIVSVHAYTPYYFCLDGGSGYLTYETGDMAQIDNLFNDINTRFISQGVPVIIGETGCLDRGTNHEDRLKWAEHFWGAAAKLKDIALVLWDNNVYTSYSDNLGSLNRETLKWADKEYLDIIMKYSDGTPAKVSENNQGSQDEQGGQTQPDVTADATLLNTYGAEYGYIGTCINSWQLKDASTLAKIKKQYNSVTLENEMKPDAILGSSAKLMSVAEAKAMGYVIPDSYKESTVPVLKFSTVDEVMKICCENGLALRAHTLVWHSQSPTWFFKKDYNGSNAFVDAKTMDARLEMYVKTVMSHVYSNEYGKCVYAWDVVNEYPHASKDNWLAVYGDCGNSPEFVKKAFVYANEVLENYKLDGQVSLLFNDYNTYMEVDKVIAIVNYINSGKKVCTGVGMQSHVSTWYPSVDYFTAALKSFLNAGLEVQITEMDIKSNRKDDEQATYAYQLFKNINNIKKTGGKITSVTWWGFADEMSWIKEDNALLFSKLDEPKAAYTSVLKAYTEVFGIPKGVKDPTYVNPVGPDKPIDPVEPDEPVNPVDPVEPDKPVDPVEPDKPVAAGLTSEYTINNWGSGYQVLIKVKNETGKRAETWSLKVNKNDCKIDSSWNVNIVESGDYYVITPMTWNSVIENGNAVEFGVQGNGNIGTSVEIIIE